MSRKEIFYLDEKTRQELARFVRDEIEIVRGLPAVVGLALDIGKTEFCGLNRGLFNLIFEGISRIGIHHSMNGELAKANYANRVSLLLLNAA